MIDKDGNYVLNVDKEKAEGGTYSFGIDIQHEDGRLAKRIDLEVVLKKKEEENGDDQEVEGADDEDDEDNNNVDA